MGKCLSMLLQCANQAAVRATRLCGECFWKRSCADCRRHERAISTERGEGVIKFLSLPPSGQTWNRTDVGPTTNVSWGWVSKSKTSPTLSCLSKGLAFLPSFLPRWTSPPFSSDIFNIPASQHVSLSPEWEITSTSRGAGIICHALKREAPCLQPGGSCCVTGCSNGNVNCGIFCCHEVISVWSKFRYCFEIKPCPWLIFNDLVKWLCQSHMRLAPGPTSTCLRFTKPFSLYNI